MLNIIYVLLHPRRVLSMLRQQDQALTELTVMLHDTIRIQLYREANARRRIAIAERRITDFWSRQVCVIDLDPANRVVMSRENLQRSFKEVRMVNSEKTGHMQVEAKLVMPFVGTMSNLKIGGLMS